jgi:uncharacterized protein (DUF2267 family)
MEYNQFVHQVQTRARLRSATDAITATRATLQTLAERVGASQLAPFSQVLPAVFGAALADVPVGPAKPFSFDNFCQRLADREQADVPVAVFHARCVVETLRGAGLDERVAALAAGLTPDYAPLFRTLTDRRAAA